MELDKRIKEGKRPLTCFDTEQAKEFLGKECYLSNSIADYADLNNVTAKRILDDVSNTSIPYSSNPVGIYCYCLPCEWAEEPEKKYRPYKNIQELFEDIGVYIGDFIHFRSKAKETESHALITSYTTLKNGTEKICLGGAYYYTMQALFDLFELRSRGEWQPFGIEVKEE